MSKMSVSVSSGVPNSEKQMKARDHRPSTFIVSRCLEPLMKKEAQVFDMTSHSCLKIQYNKARKINVFPMGMVNSYRTFQNCNFHVVNNFSKYGSE